MTGKEIRVGGLEIPYAIGDDFYTILEPDRQARYEDHFVFKVVGPDTVNGLLIDSQGIYISSDDDYFIPIIEIFKSRDAAEEFLASLGIEKLPFKENDIVYSPRGEDAIAALSIDFDRRKLIIRTAKGYNFTMEEWGDTVSDQPPEAE
ncbi:MAG: hypothetical protein IKN17_08575 [Ruminococcus sp.]|nr:hypothetical protein [Ruminococcus sp.]